jgi:hypothetical protein
MKNLMLAFVFLFSASYLRAAIYQRWIDQNQTSMDDCKVSFSTREPSAILTYKTGNQVVKSPI